ncbi:MAG: hypothetical protein IJK23_09795 [Clostridia bacterium]|nr:hypothetical protein [Clostridia bacterium]
MMRIETKSGYKAYHCTATEIKITGGKGICDSCGKPHRLGYLIPVLNRWYCEGCFNEWDNSTRFYGSDNAVEQRVDAYYRQMIPLTG